MLDDPSLHAFIGGHPASEPELRSRYERQGVGRSPDGSEGWLNWVVRRSDDGSAVGTVQATVRAELGGLSADVAWMIASGQQRRGYATEAARAMVAWLREHGVDEVVAYVHPEHCASQRVARALGLAPQDTIVDGEVRWEGRHASAPAAGVRQSTEPSS